MTPDDTEAADAAHWLNLVERAAASLRLSQPNPRVACRIRTRCGRIFDGHTQAAGGAHAEVVALRAAQAAGADLRGAAVWVTLEPCSHHGRTPPCCDALIAAGVGRVLVAVQDPNPQVAGRGLQRLRAAGVEVELLHPNSEAARAARELNIGFFSRMIRQTPWVRMKVAASLDGVTALPNGASQWITDASARADGHAWRARACALLTGIGTVLQDDPMLDVRLAPTPRQPHLVLVDSRLQTPLDARLWQAPAQGGQRKIFIYFALPHAARQAALQARGATLIHLPGQAADTPHKVDLAALLRDLGRREVNELHVEAGHQLNGSLLRAGLVDELLLYQAPKLLGQGAGLSNIGPLAVLQDGVALSYQSVERVGQDLRIVARVSGRDAFLHP
ncbi:bifunctional diaminohydroxyphosphoribosylaminopyrimidine deaminase/5-amino-6-(5-phosphoribosylamino)uracil reductase RibD [Hydrogenophaga sp.]|uniref:bifunctional diaminohydroxyphosphoribosylaminopyrimidine deaminase/5-amino-6-(5-phosphoribosylamino)uracil reductase RibD n=1 Tax=Hydrogenophaga sp. TaxID=1904254 RepID=UPI0019906AA0|nr:bifunctional diaminohydroxyphosphoribosylaminopyrimidine deaminase/5-amino-6-(5-phosphoribosylamino)uracil reductase RibD [Hydrogenophaga sp.]MBD3893970.1 bifunctional diaminohydroxyphosphoribosylaminopyrimidine deaminase/5-amino-6-(5-phosphoribosylamino)uracil reductase RibD [Hydrogenophaga sp.]